MSSPTVTIPEFMDLPTLNPGADIERACEDIQVNLWLAERYERNGDRGLALECVRAACKVHDANSDFIPADLAAKVNHYRKNLEVGR